VENFLSVKHYRFEKYFFTFAEDLGNESKKQNE